MVIVTSRWNMNKLLNINTTTYFSYIQTYIVQNNGANLQSTYLQWHNQYDYNRLIYGLKTNHSSLQPFNDVHM